MNHSRWIGSSALLLLVIVLWVHRAGRLEADSYRPVIDPANFTTQIDNPLSPLTPHASYTYQGIVEDGEERNTVEVTKLTKVIMGVTCVVVQDTVFVDGELVELTYDYFAQDKQGKVWYFGEDSKEYANGVVVSTEGSWEAGVNNAQPGIVMEAQPNVGDTYRQEFSKGVAEDMAEVLSTT